MAVEQELGRVLDERRLVGAVRRIEIELRHGPGADEHDPDGEHRPVEALERFLAAARDGEHSDDERNREAERRDGSDDRQLNDRAPGDQRRPEEADRGHEQDQPVRAEIPPRRAGGWWLDLCNLDGIELCERLRLHHGSFVEKRRQPAVSAST